MPIDAIPDDAALDPVEGGVVLKDRRRRNPAKAAVLQNAILNSAAFASIATDETGVIQIFNAGAERMLGYAAAEVMGRLTPAAFSAPDAFEALVSRASRGIDVRDELTWICKDGSRLPVVAFVSALHDPKGDIAGYLLIATIRNLSPALAPQAAPEPLAGCAAVRSRLLYVEDQPASFALVEQLLARRPDMVLLRAPNEKRALELARAERPEAILLSADLPGIGAVALMKLLRAEPASVNTPILALGPDAGPAGFRKAIEAGFFTYLARPVSAEPFLEALHDALEFAARERSEENDMPLRRAAHIH